MTMSQFNAPTERRTIKGPVDTRTPTSFAA